MEPRMRMGMVGGGSDAFIGPVHRMAASMEGGVDLVCGAFSSTRQRSIDSGTHLLADPSRAYSTYREMFRKETKLPEDVRMQFVSIVTPNNMHYPVAMAALDNGFHVVCGNPMTCTTDEALNLEKKVKQAQRLFCLAQNHNGYPMVKEARILITSGKLGPIRRVVVECPQGWLVTRMETAGVKQAAWRTDPKRAGATCCMGDIGSHCESLLHYITGLSCESVCAEFDTFVKGRQLEDDASVLMKLGGGAQGVLWATQIGVGEENGLNIRVYGEKGSLVWHQQEPNTLLVHRLNRPTEVRRTGTSFVSKAADEVTRLPSGHPEGYIEAFANVYRSFFLALANVLARKKVKEENFDYPTVHDGVRGMKFLDAVVRSSKAEEKWTAVE